MNYTPQLLEVLAQSAEYRELFLAPYAVPALRRPGDLRPVADQPMSDRDIQDTLVALRAQAGGSSATLGKEGSFSFGLSGVGRFRVWYLTQRGSYIVAIFKIPLEVPSLETLLETPDAARQAVARFEGCRRGLLIVTGNAALDANLVVYALLRHVSERLPRVMFLVETSTMFLLKHGRSIVVQCELGTDVAGMDQAVRTAFQVGADLLFVRDVSAPAECELVWRAAQMGLFVVITMSSLDLEDYGPFHDRAATGGLVRGIWRAERRDNGRLALAFQS